MTLYCATTNPGKVREFRLAAERLGCAGLEVELLPGMRELPVCEETGDTFEANAVQKAVFYSRYAPGPVFADDSGLVVDALDGAPGVYSARFAGPDANDKANNRLLLEKLDGVENRAARFVCAIAVAEGGEVRGTYRGQVEGRIIYEERGAHGFGYDPLFYCPEFEGTFGETLPERKLLVSHRGRAFAAMCAGLTAR